MHQPALSEQEFELVDTSDQVIWPCCSSSGRDGDDRPAFDLQGTVTLLVLEAAEASPALRRQNAAGKTSMK